MNIERIKAVGFGIIEPKGKFLKIDFTRRSVGDKDILIDIMYAGICHSDIHVARGEWGEWNDKNVIPGHEIVGLVKQVGKDVTKFKIGDIAAIGCMVDACGECENCKAGHELYCTDGTVLTYDSIDWKHHDEVTKGGYSTNYVLNEDFAIKIPKSVSDKLEKIPSLCCAGITTYAPIVSANVNGKSCAVIGLGGLGHMAVKYLHSFGAKEIYAFDTVNKADSEEELDITFVTVSERNIKKYFLKFDFIISTVPFDYDLGLYMSMVKKGGDMAVVGLPEYESTKTNFSVKTLILDCGNVKIWGSLIGGIPLTQECVDYSIKHKIFPDVEIIKPDPKEIDEAYEKVRSGKVRFRYVIDMTKGEGVEKFQKGGEITDSKVESAAEKISRLMEEVIKPAAEAGNLTAMRLMDLDQNFYTFTEDDVKNGYNGKAGDKGNVYLSSRGEYTTPGVRYINGLLQYVGPNEKWSDEVEAQSIKFPSELDAKFFGENYHNFPEFVPTLRNPQYKKQGGQLDMTLEELLNSSISESAKEELKLVFAKGGELKYDKIPGTIDVPETILDYMDEEQLKGSKIFTYKGKKYYLNGDGQGIPAEHYEKHPEDRGRQIGYHENGGQIAYDQWGNKIISITIETLSGSDEGVEVPTDATVTIGNKSYDVKIADTERVRKEGLSKCVDLPEDEGMLFVFEEPTQTPFTMKDTSIDLDIIFIDEDGEVIETHSVKAHDEKPVECSEEFVYVLEVNYGSGIEEGDELEIESDDFSEDEKETLSKNKMLVLDSEGNVQCRLLGGERLYSRIFSRKLIKASLRAYKLDTEAEYRRVGRMVCRELNAQDSRPNLYVNAPEKKGEKDDNDK